jgi:hypothetical protein
MMDERTMSLVRVYGSTRAYELVKI